MFETAELGRKVSKEEYKEREPILRQELLQVQRELLEAGRFPVIILFAGVDGAGKGQTVNKLNEWMDPRWLINRAYDAPSDEERERPEFWRFWLDLPPRGQIAMFLSAWYSRPLLDKAYDRIDRAELDKSLDRIIVFEKGLVDEGALILKFWMHLSRDSQKKRLKSLEKDPFTRWQIKKSSWEHWRMYDKFMETTEHMVRRCNTGSAPITIVEGLDPYYRSLKVGTIVRDAVRKKLQAVQLEDKLQTELATTPETNGDSAEPIEMLSSPGGDNGKAQAGEETPLLTVLTKLDMTKQLAK